MYHIFYRPKGQKGSSLETYRVANARDVWDSMVNQAHRTGLMRHPESGVALDFASLQYGGVGGHSGMLCQKWDANEGVRKVFEPEPNYGMLETPEQPPPPSPELEAYFAEPIEEEKSFSDVEN